MNINKLCLQTHKNTGEFHCVSFDTWPEYTCECGKAAHGSLLHSIITGEIYSLSSYYIVCVCVLVQNFRMETELPKCVHCSKWNWMELTGFGSSGPHARSPRMPQNNLIWISKRISYFGELVMPMLLCLAPQTLERMQRPYTFFVLSLR